MARRPDRDQYIVESEDQNEQEYRPTPAQRHSNLTSELKAFREWLQSVNEAPESPKEKRQKKRKTKAGAESSGSGSGSGSSSGSETSDSEKKKSRKKTKSKESKEPKELKEKKPRTKAKGKGKKRAAPVIVDEAGQNKAVPDLKSSAGSFRVGVRF